MFQFIKSNTRNESHFSIHASLVILITPKLLHYSRPLCPYSSPLVLSTSSVSVTPSSSRRTPARPLAEWIVRCLRVRSPLGALGFLAQSHPRVVGSRGPVGWPQQKGSRALSLVVGRVSQAS